MKFLTGPSKTQVKYTTTREQIRQTQPNFSTAETEEDKQKTKKRRWKQKFCSFLYHMSPLWISAGWCSMIILYWMMSEWLYIKDFHCTTTYLTIKYSLLLLVIDCWAYLWINRCLCLALRLQKNHQN